MIYVVTKGGTREPRRAGPEVCDRARTGARRIGKGDGEGVGSGGGNVRGLIYRVASIEINSPSDPVRLRTRRLIGRSIDRSRSHFGWRLRRDNEHDQWSFSREHLILATATTSCYVRRRLENYLVMTTVKEGLV